MNLLIISPYFNYSCGVSKHVFLLLRELKEQPDINLFFITNSGNSLDRLIKIGINPILMKFKKGWINLLYLLPNYFWLKYFCKKNNINIIHTHHRYPEFLAFLLSRYLNIRTVSTVQSLVHGKKLLSFKSHKLIVISDIVKKQLINEYNIDESKITKLFYFLDPYSSCQEKELIEFRINNKIKFTDIIILFVGRINLIKGADVLLKVISGKILPKYKNIKFILVGSFELDKSYKKIIGNNSNIFFYSSTSEVSFYYQLSDLVILPSRIEPFGLVMVEAGLFRKPFIGGNTGGIAEFIEDKKNGLLVEPGNFESLTRAIEWVLDNPGEAKQLGENLYQKVLTLTSKEEYIKKLLQIYND